MTQESRRLGRKVRNSYLVSTVSIALVLFLLGAMSYVIINAMAATGRLRESFSVTLMLKKGADVTGTGRLLKADPAVKSAVLVTREQAAEEFRAFMKRDFVTFLGENPLPDSYDIKLNGAYYAKDSVNKFERRVMAWAGSDELVYQRAVLEQAGKNLNKFNMVMLVFGAMLFFICIVLLNNTIKVTVFAKRYTISTMKLVGATPWFIMRPILLRALLQGLVAGVVSCAMFYGMVAGLTEGMPEINFATGNLLTMVIMAAMAVAGIVISVLFTTFAVSKFLRMHTNNIHLY